MESAHIRQSGQSRTSWASVVDWARQRMEKGITIGDLMTTGLAKNKEHAMNIVRHMKKRGILYTGGRKKPQVYYLTECKSTIECRIAHNGVSDVDSKMLVSDDITKQSLESFVLPMLKDSSAYIHRLQFKVEVMDYQLYEDVYDSFCLPSLRCEEQNGGKSFERRLGDYTVRYVLYPKVIMAYTNSSRHPHRLLTDDDHLNLLAFLGQIRQELCSAIQDRYEKVIPSLSEWLIMGCDINKDIQVSNSMHFSGLKIQVKHLDHLFRLYIKDMGDRTVCRVEQALSPKMSATQFIFEEFTQANTASRLSELENEVKQLKSRLVGVAG